MSLGYVLSKAKCGKHARSRIASKHIGSPKHAGADRAIGFMDSGLNKALAASALSLALLSTLAVNPLNEAFAANAQGDSAEEKQPVQSLISDKEMHSASENGVSAVELMKSSTVELNEFASDYAAQARVDSLLDLAKSKLGCAYVTGGVGPNAFDCSGLTQYCFRNALGIELPRTAAAQSACGESVSMDSLQPGDLLCWSSGRSVYHVGIYVGDGSYIHAAGHGKGVTVQTMQYFNPSFAKRLF